MRGDRAGEGDVCCRAVHDRVGTTHAADVTRVAGGETAEETACVIGRIVVAAEENTRAQKRAGGRCAAVVLRKDDVVCGAVGAAAGGEVDAGAGRAGGDVGEGQRAVAAASAVGGLHRDIARTHRQDTHGLGASGGFVEINLARAAEGEGVVGHVACRAVADIQRAAVDGHAAGEGVVAGNRPSADAGLDKGNRRITGVVIRNDTLNGIGVGVGAAEGQGSVPVRCRATRLIESRIGENQAGAAVGAVVQDRGRRAAVGGRNVTNLDSTIGGITAAANIVQGAATAVGAHRKYG